MSLTGLNLRDRARRRAARLLDQLATWLDEAEPAVGAPPPAPPPAPVPAAAAPPPAPQPAKPALAPLPKLDKPEAPKPGRAKAPKAAAAKAEAAPAKAEAAPAKVEPAPKPPAPASVGETPAAAKARQSPEDRQRQHWERTRKGLLAFVHEHGGKAGLRELHEHSEKTYFVAHVGFSRMMEELTDQGFLSYDHDTATATLTDAGRTELP